MVRAGVMHSSFGWKHWIGLIFTSLAYFLPYQQLQAMSKPTYGNDGELIDGGFDMSTGGICGYACDSFHFYLLNLVTFGLLALDSCLDCAFSL